MNVEILLLHYKLSEIGEVDFSGVDSLSILYEQPRNFLCSMCGGVSVPVNRGD